MMGDLLESIELVVINTEENSSSIGKDDSEEDSDSEYCIQ